MRGIIDDILNAFRKNNNQVVQLLLIGVFLFFMKLFLLFASNLFPNPDVYQTFIQQNLILSTNFKVILTHPWTFITFPFTNSGFLDLLFNSLAIFWFGNLLTDFLGGRKTFIVYFLGAIFSSFFYFLVYFLMSSISKNVVMPSYLFGSNTGVYAILFASVALLPDYELSFFRIFIKLKYLALAFLLISFLNPNSGVLNLGGAIFGYLHVKFLRTGWNILSPFEQALDWMIKLGKPKNKMPFKSFSKTPVGDFQRKQHLVEAGYGPNQEEIDYLLDKISNNGYESLSKDEKHRLFIASQKKD